MNLVVVGGHERMEKDYINIGKQKGYKTKVFTTMSSKFNNSIGRPDAIVIFTSAVSHKMTSIAENQAKKNDILIVRHRNSSKIAFKECLDRIDECIGNCKECKYNKMIDIKKDSY